MQTEFYNNIPYSVLSLELQIKSHAVKEKGH